MASPPDLSHLRRQMWAPIVAGCVLIAFFVVGGIAWATVSDISGAVLGQSFVRVEANRKTVKHRDGGTIKSILVREGQRVVQDELLMVFNDVEPRSQVEVLRNQYQSLAVQRARFQAERDGARQVEFPSDLVGSSDERLKTMIRDQENVFRSRLSAFESQEGVLKQKTEQLRIYIEGLKAQILAVDKQIALIEDELKGLLSLFEKGYTPRTRILALQRTAADLSGTKGRHQSDIARTGEQIGEAELQLIRLRQQRETEAAEGLRETQVRLEDTIPRLRAAEQILERTQVRAPASGYVLNLTQFTEGGVVTPGERLLDIVPSDAPLVFEARLRPQDIDEVVPGMPARVQLFPNKARFVPQLEAKVVTVSADRMLDQRSGEVYYQADIRLLDGELARIGADLTLYPGMPADVMIVTGNRSIMAYLFAPFKDSLKQALREH